MSTEVELVEIFGEPSWRLATEGTEAYVTRRGGHIAPVTHELDGQKVQPYHVAPWYAEPERAEHPVLLQVLRGDFFCMPFGGNEAPYRGEAHPAHGQTAQSDWEFEALYEEPEGSTLHLKLETTVRPGRVDKLISVQTGQNAIYSRHILSGYSGPMNIGHHANLRFPDLPGSGLISTAPFAAGQVCPLLFEQPEGKGYTSLRTGAGFTSLKSVPSLHGEADLTRYPARRGWEDLVQFFAEPGLKLGWTAVAFPDLGYVWISLKDPRVLNSTVLWHSNGGRHYAPWNGRHINVLGLEEVTSNFHFGLAESAGPNGWTERGFKTVHELTPDAPLNVNTIMAVAAIPADFTHVATVEPAEGGVLVTDENGASVLVPLDLEFLGLAE